MASHVFVKEPRADDPLYRRVAEVAYVVAVATSDILWSWVEDTARRIIRH